MSSESSPPAAALPQAARQSVPSVRLLKGTFVITVRNLTQPHPETACVSMKMPDTCLPIFNRLKEYLELSLRSRVNASPFQSLKVEFYEEDAPDDQAMLVHRENVRNPKPIETAEQKSNRLAKAENPKVGRFVTPKKK